ncbi:MAG: T9SS type A sorting domain-containing protein [Bacteroidia bacterium]
MKKLILSMLAISGAAYVNAQTPAAVPNGDMETWGSTAPLNEPQEPTGWVSENVFCSSFMNPADPVSVTKYTSSPFLHTASAQITTVNISPSACTGCGNPTYPAVADTVGMLLLGTVKTSAPYLVPGAPYTDKPQTFSYETQYTPASGSDSAYVVVQLTKRVGGVRTIISQNAVNIPPSSVWSAHSFSLNYTNPTLVPDSVTIIFTSSYNRKKAAPGSVLLVDALAFTGINGIQEYPNLVHFSTYPNPANTELNLNTDAGKVDLVTITDMSGRTIETVHITSDHTVMNTGKYDSGLYLYTAFNKEGVIQARGKFNVTK